MAYDNNTVAAVIEKMIEMVRAESSENRLIVQPTPEDAPRWLRFSSRTMDVDYCADVAEAMLSAIETAAGEASSPEMLLATTGIMLAMVSTRFASENNGYVENPTFLSGQPTNSVDKGVFLSLAAIVLGTSRVASSINLYDVTEEAAEENGDFEGDDLELDDADAFELDLNAPDERALEEGPTPTDILDELSGEIAPDAEQPASTEETKPEETPTPDVEEELKKIEDEDEGGSS